MISTSDDCGVVRAAWLKGGKISLLAAALALAGAGDALAAEPPEKDGSSGGAEKGSGVDEAEQGAEEAPLDPTMFGVGVQTSWPSFGLSGVMDLNERAAVQAILGVFGRISMFAGKGLYRFSREELWNVYGYGTAGVVSHKYWRERETTLGLGAGVGLEYDWRAWQRKLPPIRWNIELGLAYADFDYYSYSGLSFGGGLHYRF